MTHTLMWTGTDIILLSITPLNVSKDITGTGSSERLRKTEDYLSRAKRTETQSAAID